MRRLLIAAIVLLVTAVVVASGDASRHDAQPLRPPQRLSETGLYLRSQPGTVAPANRAFSPQYPLWSDGAAKSRWVYLPPDTRIDAADGNAWQVPVGTKFWKEFSFADRRVETRMIWRAAADQWVFASYVWNDDQTEAILAPPEGVRGVADVGRGKRHDIPSATDCTACHGTARPGPLGFNALQLSPDRDPGALHAEPLRADMLTLQTLLRERRLENAPTTLESRAPRIASTNPRTRAVMGYLVANCGGCHNGRGEIAAAGPVLRYEDLLRDADAVADALIGLPTKWQAPGRVEGTVLVDTHAPEQSALLARLRSRSPSAQMPPLGTVIRDNAAVQVVGEWISRDLAARAQRSRR